MPVNTSNPMHFPSHRRPVITLAGNGGAAGPQPFASTWKTDNAGSSTNFQIQLPLISTGTYAFNVDWGDGNDDDITVWSDPLARHTYASTGTYNVTITGDIKGWRFNNIVDKLKILSVESWGPLDLSSEGSQFKGCANLTSTATDRPLIDTTAISLFESCTAFNGQVNSWNTSGITNFQNCFKGAAAFNQDLSGWDVSSAVTLTEMFRNATVFNGNVDAWNVSACVNAARMFQSAAAFNRDISGWDPGLIISFFSFFDGATVFDQDIGGWDVTSCANMSNMFLNGGLSTANYDALLIGWEAQAVKTGVSLHAGVGTTYSAGAAATAHSDLQTDHTWTFTDGGPA